jgi:ketosteroid isomerase-like protein
MGTATKAQAPLFATAQEAEQAFYDALAQGDLDAVMQVWADEDDIVCIHPGDVRLTGQQQIRQSWQEILEQGTLHIELMNKTSLHTASSATLCNIERLLVRGQYGLQAAYCNVTNVFHKGPTGWHMVLHHASPADLPSGHFAAAETPSVLH